MKVCKGDGCVSVKHDHSRGCWLWMDSLRPYGYGHLYLVEEDGSKSVMVRAPRFALYLAHGTWPKAMACHKCDNRACVRVDVEHVYDGTPTDNMRDFYRRPGLRVYVTRLAHGTELAPVARGRDACYDDRYGAYEGTTR
jgi:hypothetical protein